MYLIKFYHQRQANCFEFNHTLKREPDARLGYHIEPHIGIEDQPIIVQISITLAVSIVVIGFISG
jgi:hypothetical protein